MPSVNRDMTRQESAPQSSQRLPRKKSEAIEMRTREEHLAWCKQRAHEYLDRGDLLDAVTSMMSDLDKHPEFGKTNPFLAMTGMLAAQRHDLDGVRRFIDGFNAERTNAHDK
jgi:hypothetical protein